MNLNLAISGIVGAGGGIAFVLVGLLVAVSRGGERARPLLAVACVAFGIVSALTSLTYPDNIFGIRAVTIAGFVGALAFTALALEIASPLDRRARQWIAAAALVVTLVGAALVAASDIADLGRIAGEPALVLPTGYAIAAMYALSRSLPLVWIAAAVRARAAEARGWGSLTIGLGAYAFSSFAILGLLETFGVEAWRTDELLTAIFPVLAAFAWLPTGRERDPRTMRLTILGLLGMGLLLQVDALLVYGFDARDLGVQGLLTTLGALLVARALLKDHILGISPPAFAISRGPIAAGALATLFVVAQLAQNFLSAQYGLVMGGIVAGTFLFAAQPLQRAVERLQSPAPTAAPDADAAEALYRENLRLVLKDARVSADEEQHLAELAERLGIRARRAVQLRHEVEREKGVR